MNIFDFIYAIVVWVYETSQGLYDWLVNNEFANGYTMWEMIQNPAVWVGLLVVWIGVKVVGAFLP